MPIKPIEERRGDRLIQFQCQREGTMFYYQTAIQCGSNRSFIAYCPVCGSKRVKETGRMFAPVQENMTIQARKVGEPLEA